MANRLYNGVELPELPSNINADLPSGVDEFRVHTIVQSSSGYHLIVTESSVSYLLSSGLLWYNGISRVYNCLDGEWVFANQTTSGVTSSYTLIWSNEDVHYDEGDGGYYFYGSVSVPVDGDTEGSETENVIETADIYQGDGGAWSKKGFREKDNDSWEKRIEFVTLNGKWVKVGAIAESVIPRKTSFITISSAEWFSIFTHNKEKNWDGTIYYSNDAINWIEWKGTAIESAKHGKEHRIYMRGFGNSVITGADAGDNGRFDFNGSKQIRCEGNIENLLDCVTVADGNSPVMGEHCFASLFNGCYELITAPDLPSTNLTKYCYASMFEGCSQLTTAPDLPATTLADGCYRSMFAGCYKLTKAPDLKATNLTYSCYYSMFNHCTSLTIPPELPATALEQLCYGSMFRRCTSLIALPALRATSLMISCYSGMFVNCTGIKLSTTQTGEYQTPYRIPTSGTGTTASSALNNMFKGTGGTFTGTPEIDTTYYASNAVI